MATRQAAGSRERAAESKARVAWERVGPFCRYLTARRPQSKTPNRYAESLYLIVKNYLSGQAANRRSKASHKPRATLGNRQTDRPRQRPLKRLDQRAIKPAGNILCWGCSVLAWPDCNSWVKLSNCHDNFSRCAATRRHGAAVPIYIHTFFSEQSKKNDNLTQEPPEPACLLGLRMGHACSPA